MAETGTPQGKADKAAPDGVTFLSGTAFETAAWQDPNRTAPPPPENTFELGLVMAGAVSAGAYTAGVIDFIVEALDTWDRERAAGNPRAPTHQVRVPVMSGTSAGGMTTAILAAVAHRDFPHVRMADSDAAATGNPLFDAWVNQIDWAPLVRLHEANRSGPPSSILNGDVLDGIVTGVLDDAGTRPSRPRVWLGEVTRVILTATNLRGTPYWQDIKGVANDGYGMNNGRDHQTFALHPPASDDRALPDEIALHAGAVGSHLETWAALGQWALATGAFPVALPPRLLRHRPGDRDHRIVVADPETPGHYIAIVPGTTRSDSTTDQTFLAVDGGVLNNEPLNLARRVLAGGDGRNPRQGHRANRATLLIDPFPAFEASPAPKPGDRALWRIAGALLATWKGSARFNAEDLLLAMHAEVYSRFQVAPVRGDTNTPRGPLACGVMGGFGGFLHRAYRRHDYLLGRRNAQRMLRQHLVLPAANPLFKRGGAPGGVEEALRDHRADHADGDYYPIIPIIPGTSVDAPEPLPDWPAVNLVDVDTVSRRFADRADAVLGRTLATMAIDGVGRFFLSILASTVVKRKVRKEVRAYLAKALGDWHLRDLP
ncbi:patatin-like phospholipase family protein [Roseospira visakhapatnamensis]|uniref:PNPLA domain-containing protein n=1 Tax=Roseospira visakhapatnamensis TaxID=390880 RepID=A0A7W6RG80_9PROT|nr:patatin-like phospholipase family protein [Roseospira visakhapatnamensis]MBB4267434.1 hypothetical protein [Roseospira visakhapatnamensis]